MGLDTVELVTAFEEEFDVQVPDDAAESVVSVRDLADWVVREHQRLGRKLDPDEAFIRIRRITSEQTNVRESEIGLDTKFVEDLGMD